MPQTQEAEAFLNRIVSLPDGPGISLHDALQPSLDDEADLRKLFATDKTNNWLSDPLVGLVDVFDAPTDIRRTRARVVKGESDLSSKYIMPLVEADRRNEGTPCMVAGLEEFQRYWTIFTEGSLSQLVDWNNVVAAGGSVLACMTPLPGSAKESRRTIRKHFHSAAYPTSDVDLFLWGMDAEQAERKIVQIYEAVRDSVPWDVTCVRTKHAVSIHSQYPYRSIQIVLRLYSSPAEILAGFDIDAPCCLYNGSRVLANPRCIVAMMRQANTVDTTRRSPSYEVRLAKYARRGFEVYVSTLERDNIDPTIYERSISRIEGLARLLVLEKLANPDARYTFLESRRNLRGRPNPLNRYRLRAKKLKGDLKVDIYMGLEMNDYDVASMHLHIPYGPGWTARRIDKLIYQTDLGMNSTFNPKNKDRRLHRHPAFFGTMEECLEDCCEHCPEPVDADERKLQEEEDKNFLRGRISFIEEDPGRQTLSGSFNPIDVGSWSAQAYIGPMEHFFNAIVARDRDTISQALQEPEFDVNRRDHVGRTALHLALFTGAEDIACDLIDAAARISARLADGRNALHLAAQYDLRAVLKKLFERSKRNKEEAEWHGQIQKRDDEMDINVKNEGDGRPSSEDDWTSEDDALGVLAMNTDNDESGGEQDKEQGSGDDDGDKDMDEDVGGSDIDSDEESGSRNKEPNKAEDVGLPEDSPDMPDILEIDVLDWDLGFTPLAHAVLSGSLDGVNLLLAEGADAAFLLSTSRDRSAALHPLTLTLLRLNEDDAATILERLIDAGMSTSTADEDMRTIFHRAVAMDKIKIVSTILKCDPNAKKVLNFPSMQWGGVTYPVLTAIERRHYSMLATLLAHDVKTIHLDADVLEVVQTIPQKLFQSAFGFSPLSNAVFYPLETAIAKYDDVAQLLLSVENCVDFNCGIRYSRGEQTDPSMRQTILEWVRFGIKTLSKRISDANGDTAPSSSVPNQLVSPWKRFYAGLTKEKEGLSPCDHDLLTRQEACQSYLIDIERILIARGAKPWNDIYPDKPSVPNDASVPETKASPSAYSFLSSSYYRSPVPEGLDSRYDELYEACFTGDNPKIEQLCLPKEQGPVTGPPSLNVYVEVAKVDQRWLRTGHTPLFAAICGRQWSTAKLIMAIAVAQYQPPESEDKFSTKGIVLYDEEQASDDGSEGSDDTDATPGPMEDAKFIDIAKRSSAIETDVHPKYMLEEANISWDDKTSDGKYNELTGNLLLKAIYDSDYDAFVNVFDLYTSSPLLIAFGNIVEHIIEKDQVDMLDHYIRKTGQGIEITQDQPDASTIATNDSNKIYLGLSVHGKKRSDLAKKNDPNATQPTVSIFPLVWMAAKGGARAVVEYLAGPRPIAAYQHYITTGGDERVYQMRRVRDLEKVLPEWLGWTVTNSGDSPLMAAILGRDLDIIKIMFAKKPQIMNSCLHKSVKFSGCNALMVAAQRDCKPEVLDYLLKKSVSPAANDIERGWNVYHILCQGGFSQAIAHLLTTLPRDVSEALLSQQSKGRLNTPLLLAVKVGAIQAVRLIINFTKATLLTRDVDGSTPLHCSIQRGYGNITEILVEAAPSHSLSMENGVGEVPLDMAVLKHTLRIVRDFTRHGPDRPSCLTPYSISYDSKRVDLNGLEPELQRLHRTIDQLVDDGKLAQGAQLTIELRRFVELMKDKVVTEKAIELAKQPAGPIESPRDSCDEWRTLQAVSTALVENSGKRQLVRLIDVQKSVQEYLAKYSIRNALEESYDDGEGLSPGVDEDEKSKEMKGSFVISHLHSGPDCL